MTYAPFPYSLKGTKDSLGHKGFRACAFRVATRGTGHAYTHDIDPIYIASRQKRSI